MKSPLLLGLLSLLPLTALRAAEPPVIPVDLDTFRQWDHWAYQRIGARTYMRSTYDRAGGNDGADASHFLYQLADDFNVALDVEGPGILYFARYNHWHGSPWHYVVDGTDHTVQETSTADPEKPSPDSVFIPTDLFPNPLTWTWSITKGADLMWVPIPFEKSFQMAYSRTRYGTGYFIYQQFVRGTQLSRPISSWNGRTPPDRDVLDLIGRAGSDLLSSTGTNGKPAPDFIKQEAGPLNLGKNEKLTVLDIKSKQPLMLRALDFTVPREQAIEFGKARLRVTWDGLPNPSIDAPAALFFGAGTLFNNDGREYLVKAFPVSIRYGADSVHLACYFPMPFFRSARIELIGNGKSDLRDIRFEIRSLPFKDPANHVGYFHATYRDHPTPERGHDLILLDTQKTEGGGDWTGSFAGTSFIFSDHAVLNTLEGDPRFFFDDSRTPQCYGTGTEEWGGGGDYWGGDKMTLPFAGHPVGAKNAKSVLNDEDKIESAYRFLLSDLMPFGKNAVIRMEHGGTNESLEHYQTVAYWYGLPGASLVKTDELKVGNAKSEKAHAYSSPEASDPYEITSRYEWGPDTIAGKPERGTETIEAYPVETDSGRKTAGSSEFVLNLKPENFGVLLRRKLDYSLPNQRAEVYIADKNGKAPDWKPAGIWYLAGANTCVYSNPKEELAATVHTVQTSNRRFRDDEFLIPRDLTEGRRSIRVRVKFTPVKIPLFPGNPIPELAWSEIRYDAYCFVMPPLPAAVRKKQ